MRFWALPLELRQAIYKACLLGRPRRLVARAPGLTAVASAGIPTALLCVCKQVQQEAYQVWSQVLGVLVRGVLPPRMLFATVRSCAAWIRELDMEVVHECEARPISIPLAYYIHAIHCDLASMQSLKTFTLRIRSRASFREATECVQLMQLCWPETLLVPVRPLVVSRQDCPDDRRPRGDGVFVAADFAPRMRALTVTTTAPSTPVRLAAKPLLPEHHLAHDAREECVRGRRSTSSFGPASFHEPLRQK